MVFGASAIADRRDVIPAAIEAVGGRIEHFGMPVDPGNLMLIGHARGQPVLGAPGCARSPKENGFDWVLMRLLAGLPVSREDITGMGVGGLLMEIVTRPQPREEPEPEKGRRIAAVILAAGRSTRMGGPNKLLAEIGGEPLVRIAAEEALASRARPVIVVTGHQREQVEAALDGPGRAARAQSGFRRWALDLAEGRARRGAGRRRRCHRLPRRHAAGARRADRPADRGLRSRAGALVVVPTIDGKRGNPVVWSRRFFPELMALEGDVGARHLIGRYPEAVAEVPLTDKAALVDVDTPEALVKVKAELEGVIGPLCTLLRDAAASTKFSAKWLAISVSGP